MSRFRHVVKALSKYRPKLTHFIIFRKIGIKISIELISFSYINQTFDWKLFYQSLNNYHLGLIITTRFFTIHGKRYVNVFRHIHSAKLLESSKSRDKMKIEFGK